MPSLPSPSKLTGVQWLICIIAAIGFLFDTYELLIAPLTLPLALAEFHKDVQAWTGYIMWASAVCGGLFGLLGGYLTDLLGRRRVLTWSILLYAVSSAASAFSTSAEMLLVFRCLTFIGVCVEFVAAVAWLAELFPEPRRREAVLGYTQAFASLGGLLGALVFHRCQSLAADLPAILGGHAPWRYALMSGLLPALPLIVIRPFLPESPAWQQKRAAGTLQRPSFSELFRVPFGRTTIVTTLLFACGFGAAFGAIQLAPQIVPGLLPNGGKVAALQKQLVDPKVGPTERAALAEVLEPMKREQQETVAGVQAFQEVGGLLGRVLLAWLALRIVSRQRLLRFFQIPGLILLPLVFAIPAAGHLGASSLSVFRIGMFFVGFFTIAQFSFWGNYLPRMYPTHIRGTGESFAANVGGRMIGTGANFLTTQMAVSLAAASALGLTRPTALAYSAAAVGGLVYVVGVIASFWLPEPTAENLPE